MNYIILSKPASALPIGRFYRGALALLMLTLPAISGEVAAEEAYRCRDATGVVIYSNVPQEGLCEKISGTVSTPVQASVDSERFETPKSAGGSRTKSSAKSASSSTASKSTGSRVSNNPNRVANTVQMSRDQKRRAILEEELNIEQQNLQQAKTRLTQQEAILKKNNQPLSPLAPLRQQISQHENNIDALKREIQRIPNR